MTIRRVLFCSAMLVALTSAATAPADVMVWFVPASPTVNVGGTVAVDIMVDSDVPITGWGLDFTIGEPAYAAWTDTLIGSAWDAADSIDEDGLAGLRFPDGISGQVLLATVTIQGLAVGVTPLCASSGPEEDEGFLLDTGSLATNVSFEPGCLTVIPEPSAIALLSAVALATLLRRR